MNPNLRGALFMALSMAGFGINDAITKTVMTEMSTAQIMLVRGLFATLLIGTLAYFRGAFARPAMVFHPLVALRVFCEVGSTLAFLTALAQLPLANVSAVLQALPLAVTLGAALFLREPVGWRRWLAIVAGFAGVMVIVRPGLEGFNAYAVFALLCVAFSAARDLATKRVPDEIPSLLMSTATAAVVTICGGILILPTGGWTPLAPFSVAMLFFAALLLLVGYQFIIMSMREGDISYIAPFRYTSLLWAIILGLFVFGDIPDLPMIIGASIVIASGIYTLYRERVVGRGTKPAAESTGPSMAPDGT